MSNDHSVGLGQGECDYSAGAASTPSGGGGVGASGCSCTEGLCKIKGGLSVIPVLRKISIGRRRARVRGPESPNDVFGCNCRNLKRRKYKYPRSKTEAGPLTGIVNANFGREAVAWCMEKRVYQIQHRWYVRGNFVHRSRIAGGRQHAKDWNRRWA